MNKLIAILFIILSTSTNAQCFKEISAGTFHTMAIAQNGTLWAWGDNLYGELGDGTTINKNIPTQIGTDTNWNKVSAGQEYTLAIKTDGTLWAWGLNSYTLGDGTGTVRHSPIQIGVENNWKEISAGMYKSLALKTNGTMWGWGSNSYNSFFGNINSDFIIEPTQIGADTNWNKIDMGDRHILAIKTNGTLWAWGIDYYGEMGIGIATPTVVGFPTQVGSDATWKDISAGVNGSLATKLNGTLWAWGKNNYGQIGDGSTTDRNIPTQIGIDNNWYSVSSGSSHSLAQKDDGSLWAWGYNNNGQIGNGTIIDVNVPTLIDTLTSLNKISTGSFHSISIKEDNSVWAWGWNYYGQIGDETNNNKYIPTNISCPTTLNDSEIKGEVKFLINHNPTDKILSFSNNKNQIINAISITDVTGKQVMFQQGNYTSIDVESLKTGIYFLKITAIEVATTIKFIKN